MSEIIAAKRKDVAKFQPQEARVNDVKVDAIIAYAKQLRDWPLLERAVGEKIEQQREFVEWWGETVTPNRNRKSVLAVRREQNLEKIEQLTGITHNQVSKWRRWLARETEYRAAIYGAAYKKAIAQDQNYRAEGTGQNEWYTPAKYVAAAYLVMGSIDLDPASCKEAQAVVKANRYFTKEQDGLSLEWDGNVWLNPPFSRDLIAKFTGKLASEFSSGRVKQAILLTHNNTDTEWFHSLAYYSKALCFTRGRVPFFRGDWVAAPPNGQVFFYLGDNLTGFNMVFSELGLVAVPHAA